MIHRKIFKGLSEVDLKSKVIFKILIFLIYMIFTCPQHVMGQTGSKLNLNEQTISDDDSVYCIDMRPEFFELYTDNFQPARDDGVVHFRIGVKNVGTSPCPPVPITLEYKDWAGEFTHIKSITGPPSLSQQILTFDDIEFEPIVEPGFVAFRMLTLVPGDENPKNDTLIVRYYISPEITFQHEYFQNDTTQLPVYTLDRDFFVGGNTTGWTVEDSTYNDSLDYLNTWCICDTLEKGDYGVFVSERSAIVDSAVGTIPAQALPEPQSEVLLSPAWDMSKFSNYYWSCKSLRLDFESQIMGSSDCDLPLSAHIDVSIDRGKVWIPIAHFDRLIEQDPPFDHEKRVLSYDITGLTEESSRIQIRFWWYNPNNSGKPVSWFIDNVALTEYWCRPVESEPEIAKDYLLGDNYPNPFNPVTTIPVQLLKNAQVKLSIYDLLGREVNVLVNGFQNAGSHNFVWDGHDKTNKPVASGVYFYKLETADFVSVKKMLLIR